MTPDEIGAWDPLIGMLCPKMALVLDPTALTTGVIREEALDKAAVIVSWFFSNSIMAMNLIHDDKLEMRRIKVLTYARARPGCSKRDIMRWGVTCSLMDLERDIIPTLVARGEISGSENAYWPFGCRQNPDSHSSGLEDMGAFKPKAQEQCESKAISPADVLEPNPAAGVDRDELDL